MYNCTIIIPHKNLLEFLVNCLNSIPQREDIQVIIADYGSDAIVLDLIESTIKRSYNLSIQLIPALAYGPGGARNIALEHASGRWILFSDADDDYFTDNLDLLLDYSIQTNYEVICWPVEWIGYDGNKRSFPLYFSSDFDELEELIDSKPFLQDCNIPDALYRMYQPWRKMVNRDFIKRNNISFSDTAVCNDLWYSEQVAFYAQKVGVFTKYIYRYHSRKGSLSDRVSPSYYKMRIIESARCQKLLRRNGSEKYVKDNLLLGLDMSKIHQQSALLYCYILFLELIYWRDLKPTRKALEQLFRKYGLKQ